MPAAIDQFTRAYIECALWSSTESHCQECGARATGSETCGCGAQWEDEAMDHNYSAGDLAPETLERMVADCRGFQDANAQLLAQWYAAGESEDRAGHDFWLTRNRHGAGFWDRWSDATPEGRVGRLLTDAAHAYGSVDLYVGDDEKIYAQ